MGSVLKWSAQLGILLDCAHQDNPHPDQEKALSAARKSPLCTLPLTAPKGNRYPDL